MLNSPLIHLIGKTGSGKSEYLLKTIHDRITKEMIIVLDPHGDITEKILAKSDPEEKKHIILMNLPENPNDIWYALRNEINSASIILYNLDKSKLGEAKVQAYITLILLFIQEELLPLVKEKKISFFFDEFQNFQTIEMLNLLKTLHYREPQGMTDIFVAHQYLDQLSQETHEISAFFPSLFETVMKSSREHLLFSPPSSDAEVFREYVPDIDFDTQIYPMVLNY